MFDARRPTVCEPLSCLATAWRLAHANLAKTAQRDAARSIDRAQGQMQHSWDLIQRERPATAARGAGRFDTHSENYETVAGADVSYNLRGRGSMRRSWFASGHLGADRSVGNRGGRQVSLCARSPELSRGARGARGLRRPKTRPDVLIVRRTGNCPPAPVRTWPATLASGWGCRRSAAPSPGFVAITKSRVPTR